MEGTTEGVKRRRRSRDDIGVGEWKERTLEEDRGGMNAKERG